MKRNETKLSEHAKKELKEAWDKCDLKVILPAIMIGGASVCFYFIPNPEILLVLKYAYVICGLLFLFFVFIVFSDVKRYRKNKIDILKNDKQSFEISNGLKKIQEILKNRNNFWISSQGLTYVNIRITHVLSYLPSSKGSLRFQASKPIKSMDIESFNVSYILEGSINGRIVKIVVPTPETIKDILKKAIQSFVVDFPKDSHVYNELKKIYFDNDTFIFPSCFYNLINQLEKKPLAIDIAAISINDQTIIPIMFKDDKGKEVGCLPLGFIEELKKEISLVIK